jgi:hypothetical protein
MTTNPSIIPWQFPILNGVYLLTILAIIDVPPVEACPLKTNPSPIPEIIPPYIHPRNGLKVIAFKFDVNSINKGKIKEPKIVFTVNLFPSIINPIRNKGMFAHHCTTAGSIPNKRFISKDKPTIPPEAILLGLRNKLNARAISMQPIITCKY